MNKTLKGAIKALNLPRHYLPSLYGGFKNRKVFEDIETYCMFIGYPRSGHSLIGALLDAHPDMVIAHELHALMFIYAGYSSRQIYYLILENSRKRGKLRWKRNKYSYVVSDQWQGKFKHLKVVGDKKGGSSIGILRNNPWLISKLYNKINVNIKFIHVIRNPYDIISALTKVKWINLNLNDSISFLFSLFETVQHIKKQIKKSELLELRHETFIEDPKALLRDLCQFLGVDTPVDYLSDCASIVYKTPHKSRYDVEWNLESIDIVKNKIKKYPFLSGYSYED